MEKISWGIIGCGDVTEQKSGPAFNKVANSALVAVMRRDAAKAEDYARRHGVPKWYADATQLINDPEVTAIYVATPPSTHEAYTLAALQAGKPVYVEKPMAGTAAAALRMADAAAATGYKLVVAHYRRQQQRFKKIRQLLADKVIGEPLYVRIELCKTPLTTDYLTDPKTAWRVDPSIAGGGIFHDLAPHQLDLLYYFFGPVAKAGGVAARQGKAYPADDMVSGSLLFKSGVIGNGSWCFNAPAPVDICEITGTRGILRFCVFSTNSFTLVIDGSPTVHEFDDLPHVQQPMIDATVQYFLGKGPNPCSGQEGAAIMQIIESFTA